MMVGASGGPLPQVTGEPIQKQPFAPPVGGQVQQPSDREIEAAAIAGSAAIRRIIAERNELRRERDRLNAINEELRHQNEKTTLLRDHYRQIATELLVQLRHMHQAIEEASRKVNELSADPQSRDAALMALARRFASGGNAV
jgi:hypothetical protein